MNALQKLDGVIMETKTAYNVEQPKRRGNTFERNLNGKVVKFRLSSGTLTAKVVDAEQYLIIVEDKDGNEIAIYKHAIQWAAIVK